jgi:universal stress protein A
MLHLQSILVPIDFSDTSLHALDVAESLAREHRAALRLFAVAVPRQPTEEVLVPLPASAFESGSPWPHAEEATRQQLAPIAARIADLPVTTEVCTGLPGPSIVAAALKHNVDLIVMGTQGRSGLTRLLLGSVAEHVLRHAPCPVLTIKPGTETHLHPTSPGHVPASATV